MIPGMNIHTKTSFTSTQIRDLPKEMEEQRRIYQEKMLPIFERWEGAMQFGMNHPNQMKFMIELINALIFQDKK